jgi:hypothetical protein
MRTFEDYLNTPELVGEPEFLQEIHAARLKIQDEIKGMTVAERAAYFNRAAEFLTYRSDTQITGTAVLYT